MTILPSETFFNLPPYKKEKIIKAIKKEFARVPFDKVSINKIVQDANIARGSFYMYFQDKKDMLSCVLSNYHNEISSLIINSFNKNKGDIFEVFSDIIKFTAEFGTAKDNIDFCMNIFSDHMIYNDILLKFANCSRRNDYLEWFKQYMDLGSLNLQNQHDVYDIIDILISVTQTSTIDIFLNTENKDKILEKYKNKINILKHGMLKENK